MFIRFPNYDNRQAYIKWFINDWAAEYSVVCTKMEFNVGRGYYLELKNECDYTTFALTWIKFLDDEEVPAYSAMRTFAIFD
jgi:hypothetical protein